MIYERLRTDPRSDRPIMAPGLSSGLPFKRLDLSTLDAVADHRPALPVASPANRRRGLSPASLIEGRRVPFLRTVAGDTTIRNVGADLASARK